MTGEERAELERFREALDRSVTERIVVGALRETMRAHGPLDTQHIGSAAKRIVGTIHRAFTEAACADSS